MLNFMQGLTFFSSLRKNRLYIRRDLDPRSPYWLITGGIFGFLVWLTASPKAAVGHVLLHERGIIQPISMILGGMVLAYIGIKFIIISKEIRAVSKLHLPAFPANADAVDNVLSLLGKQNNILSRRFIRLINVWTTSNSSIKVSRAIEDDTELYDLAQQSSYALPRIIVWSIPVMGFIGTVMGIGESVSGFEGFLSKADDIDVLRDGLVNVTSGLGTAFDTTFLALTISVIVVFPLTIVERIEQQLLTRIDLTLRKEVLDRLPESSSGSQLDIKAVEEALSRAFDIHLPSHEALIEPAKEFAIRAASQITRELLPLKNMAEEAISCIQDARAETKSQANEISSVLSNVSAELSSSVQSLEPILSVIQQMNSCSDALKEEISRLDSGNKLCNTLEELQDILSQTKIVLVDSIKPRRVVLVEEVVE